MSELNVIPSVDRIIRAMTDEFSAEVKAWAARSAIEDFRHQKPTSAASFEDFVHRSQVLASHLASLHLMPAINLTGIILHTGLGRARLSEFAAQHVFEVARSHSLLEIDPKTGARGSRQDHVIEKLCYLTGAESALVVNNCAGALVLALSALGRGEVLLSRGQMVEIGGSFRVPEIVRASRATLVEVGCTNKTHLSDYADRITAKTKAILRCSTSNFQMVGFTHHPTSTELADLANQNGIVFIDDLGSGRLEVSPVASGSERTMRQAIEDGAHLVLGSGDKVLGGSQAGIIVGRADLIKKLGKHPLSRALRIDKLALAALEATLAQYVRGKVSEIPYWSYLNRSNSELESLAQRLAAQIERPCSVVHCQSEVGGGSNPGEKIESFAVAIDDPKGKLARCLRLHDPAIFGRVNAGQLLLDVRTLNVEEVPVVAEAVNLCKDRAQS